MITVAVHRDPKTPTPFSEKWAHFLGDAGASVRWVNLRLPDALDQVQGCDGVMWHWQFMPHERPVAYRILHTIESYLRIPVYPDHETCWHYDNKIAQYYIFQALNVPTPQTWVFLDHEPAREWAQNATYPVVFKLSSGASSAAVRIVRSASEALGLVDRMFGPGVYPDTIAKMPSNSPIIPRNWRQVSDSLYRWKRVLRWALIDRLPDLPPRFWWPVEKGYVYFQEFLPNNDYDTRVVVIGNRAFANLRLNRPGDFRASGSGLRDFDHQKINLACIEIAHGLSTALGAQSMAYDFLADQHGQAVVLEMSYTHYDWTVHGCEGYWDQSLNWIEGHMWPEEAHVQDFLMRISSGSGSRDGEHLAG